MTTQTETTEVGRYLAAIRQSLGDLSADEREDLLEDLEAHLHEVVAESGTSLEASLGSAQQYAEELRATAGLEPAPTEAVPLLRRVERTIAGSSLWPQARQLSQRPMARAAREFVPTLRPAWWLVRGWLWLFAVVVWLHNGELEPYRARIIVPGYHGHWLVGVLALAVALVASVWLGLRQARLGQSGRRAIGLSVRSSCCSGWATTATQKILRVAVTRPPSPPSPTPHPRQRRTPAPPQRTAPAQHLPVRPAGSSAVRSAPVRRSRGAATGAGQVLPGRGARPRVAFRRRWRSRRQRVPAAGGRPAHALRLPRRPQRSAVQQPAPSVPAADLRRDPPCPAPISSWPPLARATPARQDALTCKERRRREPSKGRDHPRRGTLRRDLPRSTTRASCGTPCGRVPPATPTILAQTFLTVWRGWTGA